MNILEDGHDWMSLLQDRNLTAYTYDEQKATEMELLIRDRYLPAMKALHDSFGDKREGK